MDDAPGGIEAAVPVLQETFESYVFPDMKIGWNTYVSLIGHPDQQSARCFRCHNGVLRDPTGAEISLDCNTCHYVLATAQPDPQILKVLSGQCSGLVREASPNAVNAANRSFSAG